MMSDVLLVPKFMTLLKATVPRRKPSLAHIVPNVMIPSNAEPKKG